MTALSSDSADNGEAVLAARAVELARPVDQEPGSQLELLVVTAGGRRVALPVEGVREVRQPGGVAQLPSSSSALTGLVGDPSGALAVTSLASLAGFPGDRPAEEQWLVVLDRWGAPVGLLVDAAVDVVVIDRKELCAPPEGGGLVSALLPDGAVVLDTAVLLRDPRLSLTPADSTQERSWHEG